MSRRAKSSAGQRAQAVQGDSDERLIECIEVVIRLARVAQQTCDEVGLTLPQFRALMFAREKRRAYELANYTAVTRPAISALTTVLLNAGLIESSKLESDGRAVYYITSKKGCDLLAQAEPLLVERFSRVLGPARSSLEALDAERITAALNGDVEQGMRLSSRPDS